MAFPATRALRVLAAVSKASSGRAGAPKSSTTTTAAATTARTTKTVLEVERKFRRLAVPTLTGLHHTGTTLPPPSPARPRVPPEDPSKKPSRTAAKVAAAAATATASTRDHNEHYRPLFRSVRPLPTRAIHDVYYDTPSRALGAAGAWVRLRDGAWEAKVKKGGDFVRSRFEELRGAEAVAGYIAQVLSPSTQTPTTGAPTIPGGGGSGGVGDTCGQGEVERRLLRRSMTRREMKGHDGGLELSPESLSGLEKIAEFVTTREAWLVDGEFGVVRDRMDFGHEVGEVELQADADADVAGDEGRKRAAMEEMDRRIDEFMARYAWAWEKGEPVGKLTAYFAMAARKGKGGDGE